jgi:flagellar biosynthesis component FlhA
MDEKFSLFGIIADFDFFPILIVLIIVILLIIPIPMPVLDFLIIVNLFFAVMVLITAVRAEKAADFSLLPTFMFIFTIFSLSLNISAVRLILTKGADFNGVLIRFVSFIFAGSEGTIHLIIGSAVFIVITAIHILVIAKRAVRIEKFADRFLIDTMQVKLMAIETGYDSGAISEEEAALRKKAVQNERYFFDTLNGGYKFISGSEKCRLFIAVIIILGGILIHSLAGFFFLDNFPDGKCDIPGVFIGTVFFKDGIPDSSALGILLNSEQIKEAVRIYVPLAIGSGILFMIPSFLLSLAVVNFITKEVKNIKFIHFYSLVYHSLID